MRVLVLGGAGQLGRELTGALARSGHEVRARGRGELDISRPDEVERALSGEAFDRVVNCAAYTRVDAAEDEPEAAFAVNRDGAAIVAQACARRALPLCHLSTDFVFGQAPPDPPRPWAEVDPPEPHGVYAESKRAGELACLEAGGPLYLVRTAWLYGGSGPNFPLAICRAAARQGRVEVVSDQWGSPTYSGDLAAALVLLLEGEEFGLFHLSGAGATTWLAFAAAVLRQVGVAGEVVPTTTQAWGARAPRPPYSVLDNAHWRQLGRPPLPAWEEGLSHYVAAEREGALATFGRGGETSG